MKHSFFLAVTVCAALFAVTARATLITYDGFDYTATISLEGLNGGTGWGSAWDNQEGSPPPPHAFVVGSPGLSYGSLIVQGNRGRHVTSYENTGRRLDTSFTGAWDSAGRVSDPFFNPDIDQGVVWGSVLLQRDTATASWDTTRFVLHRNNNVWFSDARSLEIRWNGNTSRWQAQVDEGGLSDLSFSSGLGVPDLFVFKLELDPSGTNNIYVWQNPTGLGGPDLPVSTADLSFTGLSTTSARFRSLAFYGGGSVNNASSLDEVRFGTTFASVTPIPEPGAIALLSLGVLTIIYLRRRK